MKSQFSIAEQIELPSMAYTLWHSSDLPAEAKTFQVMDIRQRKKNGSAYNILSDIGIFGQNYEWKSFWSFNMKEKSGDYHLGIWAPSIYAG